MFFFYILHDERKIRLNKPARPGVDDRRLHVPWPTKDKRLVSRARRLCRLVFGGSQLCRPCSRFGGDSPGMSASPIRSPSLVIPPAGRHGSVLKIPNVSTFRQIRDGGYGWLDLSVDNLDLSYGPDIGKGHPKIAQSHRLKSACSHEFRFEASRCDNGRRQT